MESSWKHFKNIFAKFAALLLRKNGGDIHMRCPKCNSNVYSHHQKINKSGTEIKRNYACRKCKYVFETVEQIIKTDKEE